MLDLPWAGHPGLDEGPIDYRRRFVANLESRGTVMFKGKRWGLASDEREESLASLGRSLQGLLRDPRLREEAHGLLRCDYRAEWAWVRDVVDTMRLPPVDLGRFSFAVGSSDESSWLDGRIDAEPTDDPLDGVSTWVIALTMFGKPGSPDSKPSVRTDQRTLTFDSGDPYADGPANDLANAHWRAFLGDLRAAKARGVGAVDISVSPSVPWAHVAMTLGLLLDVDFSTVRLDGVWFRFSTPPAKAITGTRSDPALCDWSPAFALGLGVAGAVAVFALGALTGRRRRARIPVFRGK